jgi:hypothetical protein
MKLRVTATVLNLRSAPSAKAPLVGQLAKGVIVEQVTDGSWRHVRLASGVEGWVHGSYVENVPDAQPAPSTAKVRVPHGEQEVRALYGPPCGKECEAGRVKLPEPLPTSWDGTPVRVFACHRLAAGPMQEAFNEVYAAGLWPLMKDFGGCFNCRKVRGRTGFSTHAWGIAVDFNVAENPLGKPPQMDPRIVSIFKKHGFIWGGDFKRQDGMHYQLAAQI